MLIGLALLADIPTAIVFLFRRLAWIAYVYMKLDEMHHPRYGIEIFKCQNASATLQGLSLFRLNWGKGMGMATNWVTMDQTMPGSEWVFGQG